MYSCFILESIALLHGSKVDRSSGDVLATVPQARVIGEKIRADKKNNVS